MTIHSIAAATPLHSHKKFSAHVLFVIKKREIYMETNLFTRTPPPLPFQRMPSTSYVLYMLKLCSKIMSKLQSRLSLNIAKYYGKGLFLEENKNKDSF